MLQKQILPISSNTLTLYDYLYLFPENIINTSLVKIILLNQNNFYTEFFDFYSKEKNVAQNVHLLILDFL